MIPTFDKTQGDTISQYAELQFDPDQIALIMQISASDIHPGGQYATDYLRGRLKAQALVRQQIITMAKQGSSPAQKEFLNLVEESNKPAIRKKLIEVMKKTAKLVCTDCRDEVIATIIDNIEKGAFKI